MGSNETWGQEAVNGVAHFFDGVTETLTGAYTTPPPTINSRPPAYTPPEAWYPPSRDYDDSGSGDYYTVHTNVLDTVAGAIQAEVPALHQAIGGLRSLASSGDLAHATGGGPLASFAAGWATGNDFGAKMQSAAEGFAAAATQIAGIHSASVRKLSETAAKYAEAEDANHRSIMSMETKGVTFGNLAVNDVSDPRTDHVPLVAREIGIKPTAALAPTDIGALAALGIMDYLHSIRPAVYGDFANYLRLLGSTLDQAAARIVTSVKTLAENWDGTSAVMAFRAFQVMHTQTSTLAAQATQTGKVMRWLGDDVLPQYQAIPNPQINGIEQTIRGQGLAQQAENQYLTALNNHLSEAYAAMPSPLVGTSPSPGSGSKPAYPAPGNPFAGSVSGGSAPG